MNFHVEENSWHLIVKDDGFGIAQEVHGREGLGTRLMSAFVVKAKAQHKAEAMGQGRKAGVSRSELRRLAPSQDKVSGRP